MKKFALPLAIVVAGVLTISVLVVAKPKPVPQPAPEAPANVQVNVVEIRPDTLQLAVTAQGTVTPRREISLVAQVSGQVVSVEDHFVDGGFFAADERLIQIDDRDYQAALLAASSRLAAAEQRLAEEEGLSRQARREWRDLGDDSANDLFMRKPQLAAAKANLAAAKADLEVAQLNLERTRISVPYPGRLKETQVDLGQYVSAGTTLATAYDSSVVEVRLPLTEQQAALIDLPFARSTAANHRPEVTVIGTVAGHTQRWQGKLVRTDAYVDRDTRMYYAVVEVPEPFAQQVPLLPGLFVEALIEGRALNNVVKLPRAALYKRDKLLSLNDDNAIVETPVNVLQKSEEYVWVQGDFVAGTQVTLEKQSLTPVGMIVDPQRPLPAEQNAEPAQLADTAAAVTAAEE